MSEPTAAAAQAFGQFTHFAGFDWARSEHQVVVVDPQGRIVLSLRFADDAEPAARRKRRRDSGRRRDVNGPWPFERVWFIASLVLEQ